ncbi:MAG: GNAT family N-acetyltransferase [Boseongicola sp.]|nr:GNAT family N-acetyltransferase [Boseongicola sp.]NNL19319.1 GNAT family N-acetyltransferase [Boseongicola sp.]
MTDHPLDDPIWSSLSTEHAHFCEGNDLVRRYYADIGPLAATRDSGDACLEALRQSIETSGPVILTRRSGLKAPSGVHLMWDRPLVQMLFSGEVTPLDKSLKIEPLGGGDAEEMIALARLTKPGPFEARTHALGQFWGVKLGGRVIAMAGERMRQAGFSEISAVCTHPDHTGKGLGRALTTHMCRVIVARGEAPYLHAFEDNHSAIRLYEKLGFRLRAKLRVMALEAL